MRQDHTLNDFQGRTVLITGAAGNLGRALAQAFEDRGAQLVLVRHNRETLQHTFGEEKARRLFVAADLRHADQATEAATTAIARFGRIDVLCNLAGGFHMGETVHETTQVQWDAMFAINVSTALHMAQAVVPAMLAQGGGKIVNVGALGGSAGSGQRDHVPDQRRSQGDSRRRAAGDRAELKSPRPVSKPDDR